MNRITSIISAISIFISCIAGYRTENTEFDDLEALAISAALSYRTLAWNGSIDTDTPEFAWNTAGWYAAYKANLEFSDDAVLSGDQLKEIQNVILSGEAAAAPPDTVNTKRVVNDGKTYWEFPDIYEYFRSYLGVSSEVNCEKTGDSTFVVTIREHLRFNAVEEIVFSIGFKTTAMHSLTSAAASFTTLILRRNFFMTQIFFQTCSRYTRISPLPRIIQTDSGRSPIRSKLTTDMLSGLMEGQLDTMMSTAFTPTITARSA